MKKITITVVLLLASVWAYAQPETPNINYVRNQGTQVIKPPPSGIIYVEVSEDFPNLLRIDLCGYRGAVPIDCGENFNITMTTATGKKKTITDATNTGLGRVNSDDFPVTIDVKVIGVKGEEKYPFEFTLKLLYPGFHYSILMYEEWTRVKGIKY